MRLAGLSDLHHAAQAVQTVPEPARKAFCVQLLWQAHVADKYVKRLRKLHPLWGDGSLRAAALLSKRAPAADMGGPDYRRALALVLAEVMRPPAVKHRQ